MIEEIYYTPLIFFKAYVIFLPAMRMVLCLFLYQYNSYKQIRISSVLENHWF